MAGIKDLPKIEAAFTVGEDDFVVLNRFNYRKFIQKLTLTGSIDERDYMNRYSDVEVAIRSQKVTSATHHYLAAGYVERRAAKLIAEKGDNTNTKQAQSAGNTGLKIITNRSTARA